MNKINVYVFSGTHPIYKNLLKFPPKNITYKSNISFSDFNRVAIYKKTYEKKKKIALKFYSIFKSPRMIYLPKAKDSDLILSTRGFLILNRKPWLIEIEHADSFGSIKKINHKIVENKLASNRCKKIISRCKAVTSSLLSGYNCKKFKYKIEEVFPAIPVPKFKKEKHRKTTLLFISGYPSFFRKGGREVLEAFSILEKKYDVRLIMRAKVPEEYKKKYCSKNIIYIDKMIPYSKIYSKLYSKADIFVLPTYFDAFGISYLEAMSCGIPCIGTDIFAVPEIIENKKSGFIIHSPISNYYKNGLHKDPGLKEEYAREIKIPGVVNQLVNKCSILIENTNLRKKMGS